VEIRREFHSVGYKLLKDKRNLVNNFKISSSRTSRSSRKGTKPHPLDQNTSDDERKFSRESSCATSEIISTRSSLCSTTLMELQFQGVAEMQSIYDEQSPMTSTFDFDF
jgi:hypothetical protein